MKSLAKAKLAAILELSECGEVFPRTAKFSDIADAMIRTHKFLVADDMGDKRNAAAFILALSKYSKQWLVSKRK